jgi:hypothetical protein
VNNNAAAAAMGVLVCVFVVIAIAITIAILFCLTLQRTLTEVRERNRRMSPGLVWLYLIPLFNVFWSIYMVFKIAESLRNEFDYRGWRTEGESFGKTVGGIWSIGNVASFFISCMIGAVDAAAQNQAISAVLNLVNLVVSLTILVCWIIYWVQMAGYGRLLRENRGGYGYGPGSIEEDYDDEYGGRARRAIDDGDDYDRPRRRRVDYDDERDLDRPRRRDDDYVDEDDRPRRAADERDDDDDDRPRRRERDEY